MKAGIAIRALYFFFYGAVGIYVAFFSRYLLGIGFSGKTLGLVQMISPIASIVAAIGWTAVADRLGSSTRILQWCGFAAVLPYLWLPFAKTPITVAVVVLFHDLAAPAIVPLLDAITYDWIERRGEGSYSRIRLFGTVGFVVASQVTGLVLEARGDIAGDRAIPIAALVCVVCYAICGFLLPKAPRPKEQPNLRDVMVVLRDRRMQILVTICAFHWLSCAPYDLLFGVFLRESHISVGSVGLLYGAGTLAEMLVFGAFPWIHRRLNTRALLLLSFSSTALRWYLLSKATTIVAIACVQLLHGLSFGVFWCAAVEIIGEVVPARLRASGHALFSALVVGLGNAVGYRVSGLALDVWGGVRPIFSAAAFVELFPLLLLLVFGGRLSVKSRFLLTAKEGR